MKRIFVLWNWLLEKLVDNNELTTIILGTGAMARDIQRKLNLLNIKTEPFLIGGINDPVNNIRHYESLVQLDNPQQYRFICCYDVDEWMLIMPTFSIVYQILGVYSWNHPKVIRFSAELVLAERAGGACIDVHTHDSHSKEGHLYSVFGPKECKKAFKIHIFGACTVSGIYKLHERSIPEILYTELSKAGFESVIYAWGNPIKTVSDNLTLFLRDGYSFQKDLVILLTNSEDFDPIRVTGKNLLNVSTNIEAHAFVRTMEYYNPGEVSTGINHDIDTATIIASQHKIFLALSKLSGFSFWNIIHPVSSMLSFEHYKQLLGLGEGHFSRSKKRKDAIINEIHSPFLKDYTNTFDNESDIFSIFADTRHFTDKGNKIVAQRIASDILAEFNLRSCSE